MNAGCASADADVGNEIRPSDDVCGAPHTVTVETTATRTPRRLADTTQKSTMCNEKGPAPQSEEQAREPTENRLAADRDSSAPDQNWTLNIICAMRMNPAWMVS